MLVASGGGGISPLCNSYTSWYLFEDNLIKILRNSKMDRCDGKELQISISREIRLKVSS